MILDSMCYGNMLFATYPDSVRKSLNTVNTQIAQSFEKLALRKQQIIHPAEQTISEVLKEEEESVKMLEQSGEVLECLKDEHYMLSSLDKEACAILSQTHTLQKKVDYVAQFSQVVSVIVGSMTRIIERHLVAVPKTEEDTHNVYGALLRIIERFPPIMEKLSKNTFDLQVLCQLNSSIPSARLNTSFRVIYTLYSLANIFQNSKSQYASEAGHLDGIKLIDKLSKNIHCSDEVFVNQFPYEQMFEFNECDFLVPFISTTGIFDPIDTVILQTANPRCMLLGLSLIHISEPMRPY